MLHQTIKASLKEAMIAKDQVKLSVIRGLLTSFTNELVSKGKKPQDELNDEDVLALISRAVKQRKDSIKQFTDGGRADLASSEQAELDTLQVYLPAQMSEDDVRAHVEKKKTELAISDKAGAGILMKEVMKDLKGKADGTLVKTIIEEVLA